MTTNTEINPEVEDNDLYITDKIEQIRLGKKLKRKESGVEIRHVVYAGKKDVVIGKETKDAFDETTVKKRDRNYVLFESKIGTEKRLDIVGYEKKKPKKEQKPYQKPQLRQIRPTNLGLLTSNIENPSSTIQYQSQKPQLTQNYSYRLGIGENSLSSYLENSDSKPNQYNKQYPQLKPSISYKLGIGKKIGSSYLENSGSKTTKYNNQYSRLKPSISYKLGIGKKVESSYLENSSSKPNQFINQYPTLTPSLSFRLGYGQDIRNIGKINSNLNSNLNSNQYQKLNQRTNLRQRPILTPGPRKVERIYSHSKKKDYLDNYQYLETETVKNPRKKSFVKHIRFGDIIDSPYESNTYKPAYSQTKYTELTYNPKTISQNTVITTTRTNKPELISNQSDNNIIKRYTRSGARTPAVKTIDFNTFMNKQSSITTTNWKPSDDFRKIKPETIERQIMLRKNIGQPYETRTEIRPQISKIRVTRNQPNNEIGRIRVNRHRYQGSSIFDNNEPRLDNLNTLNVTNSIMTSSRVSRRNIKIPSFPIEKPSITPSLDLYSSSTFKPDTKVNSKVEILKTEIKNIPVVKRRQISEITFDTSNLKKRNSIRNQYKKRK